MVSPAWKFLQVETIALFSLLFSSHILQTLAFYYVNDVKIDTSEHLKDLGSHFLKTAFGLSVWIQIHINIDFPKFGANFLILTAISLLGWIAVLMIKI